MGDGSCFFRSVSTHFSGSPTHHTTIRADLVRTYIEKYKTLFAILSESKVRNCLPLHFSHDESEQTVSCLQRYATSIAKAHEWAGCNLDIFAIELLFSVNIYVGEYVPDIREFVMGRHCTSEAAYYSSDMYLVSTQIHSHAFFNIPMYVHYDAFIKNQPKSLWTPILSKQFNMHSGFILSWCVYRINQIMDCGKSSPAAQNSVAELYCQTYIRCCQTLGTQTLGDVYFNHKTDGLVVKYNAWKNRLLPFEFNRQTGEIVANYTALKNRLSPAQIQEVCIYYSIHPSIHKMLSLHS